MECPNRGDDYLRAGRISTMVGLTGQREELSPWLSALPLSLSISNCSNEVSQRQGGFCVELSDELFSSSLTPHNSYLTAPGAGAYRR